MMKFYLLRKQRVPFAKGHEDYKYNLIMARITPTTNNAVENEKCSRLQFLLEQYSKSKDTNKQKFADTMWSIDILVGVSETLFKNKTHLKGYVQLDGIFVGNCLEGLRHISDHDVNIQVEITALGGSHPFFTPYCKLLTSEMKVSAEGSRCQDSEMLYPVAHFKNWASKAIWTEVTITASLPDEVLLGNYKSKKGSAELLSVNEKILQEEILSDVTLIASNGSCIKAHKNFLAANSSAFLAMFQTDMKESRECTVEIPDMSEEAVKALLKYLYCNDMKVAQEKSSFAFELFNAGHKYQVDSLEKSMRELMLQKEDKWFEADVVVKLFVFARNLTPADDELKVKAVRVLKICTLNLEDTQSYQELFQKDPRAAMELCKYALTA